jgi:hypothetical protein
VERRELSTRDAREGGALVNMDDIQKALPEELEQQMLEAEKQRVRRQRQARLAVEAEANPPRTFALHRGEDIRAIKIPPALVAGRFVANSLVFTMGEPGVGKTFFQVSLAAHITSGQTSWLGAHIPAALRGQPVVYALAEGVGMVQVRLIGALQHITGDPLVVIPDSFIFMPQSLRVEDARSVDAFVSQIEPYRPCMVVVDTYQRHGGPETEEERVNKAIENLTSIKERLSCMVNAVHHLPKDGRQTPRGHGAIDGSIDTAVYLTRESTGDTAVRFEQRDFEPSTFHAQTKVFQVEGYINPDTGDPLTTLVFEQCSPKQAHRAQASTSKGNALTTAILAAVELMPGLTQADLCKEVGGKKATAIAEINRLVGTGELRKSQVAGTAGQPVNRYYIGHVGP